MRKLNERCDGCFNFWILVFQCYPRSSYYVAMLVILLLYEGLLCLRSQDDFSLPLEANSFLSKKWNLVDNKATKPQ